MKKHPLANCEDCPLREVGKYVPSVGPGQADIALVGEAPGLQEVRLGQPFLGPSGKLLDTVLNHYGIRRSSVLLTNACSCRHPDNATPPISAIQACRPRLQAELADRGVKTAVALGNSAAQTLLGQSGVTKLRVGLGRASRHDPNLRVITTIHPAACLRSADFFPSLVTDIGKLVIQREPWIPPRYTVITNPVDALSVLETLRGRTNRVVVDIEVDVEKDFAFEHPNRYGMLCIGLGYARGKAVVLSGSSVDASVYTELGDFLRSKEVGAHNGKFDLKGLWPHCGAIPLHFDTMLASYVLDERRGVHGLKHLAVEMLGAPQYDEEIKRYVGPRDGYGAIPADKLHKYNAYDVGCTWDLWDMFEERLGKQPELRRVHDLLVAASNQLMFVELNGIAVDRTYLDVLTDKYLDELNEIETELENVLEATGREGTFNPRSPMQVKSVLKDHFGVTIPPKRNQKGEMAESTDEETLTGLLAQADPVGNIAKFLRTLLKHRKEQKLYGTYVKGTRKRLYRGRVYPTFLLHGTTTGRLSCRNPNLQNVPRDSSIRKLFVPAREGNVFVQVDYSQAELRVLCYLAGDQYFRNIFNAGDRDIFDDLTPILYPHADKASMTPAQWKELRIRVKAYVYGLSYGREAASIATEYGISVGEAKRGMNAFFKVIPEIVAFRDETKRKVMSGQDLITPFGRHRRFMLVTEQNMHSVLNEALAFLPQSTASDMCLTAMTQVRSDLKGVAFIRNIVHDSILAECKASDAEAVAAHIDRRMIESAASIVGDYVKFATDYKIGNSWGEV